jgi:hypothetical protein
MQPADFTLFDSSQSYPAPPEDGDYGDPGAPRPFNWDGLHQQTPSSMMLQPSSLLPPIDWEGDALHTLAPYKEPSMFSTLEETNARLARERTAAEQELSRRGWRVPHR